jgi:hypothetical protein
MTTTKGGRTSRTDNAGRRSARSAAAEAEVAARSGNGEADQASETTQVKAASSSTTAPFAVFAETAASWMPEQVTAFWTQSLAELSKAPWPGSGVTKDAWDYWVDSCQRTGFCSGT